MNNNVFSNQNVDNIANVSVNGKSNIFISTLIFCLIIGFAMGVVAALAYIFIVNF